MSKTPHWKVEEITALASAFVHVCSDNIVGCDQSYHAYSARIVERFREMTPPPDFVDGSGTWKERDAKTVFNYLRDSIKKPLVKFNETLRFVVASQLSGVDSKQQFNIAVAMFLGKQDKNTRPDYAFNDFDVKANWKLFGAWNLFKNTRYFSSKSSELLCGTENTTVGTKKGGRPDGSKKAKLVQAMKKRDIERQAFRVKVEEHLNIRREELAAQIAILKEHIKENQATLKEMEENMKIKQTIKSLERAKTILARLGNSAQKEEVIAKYDKLILEETMKFLSKGGFDPSQI